MVEYVVKPIVPAELIDGKYEVLCKPDRTLCDRRPGRYFSGLTRQKDHRRFPTAACTPRQRRRIFRQGPAEVDSSAAHAARYVAKNIVAAGPRRSARVQLAYAIGVAHPVSVMVDTFGTGTAADTALAAAVQKGL